MLNLPFFHQFFFNGNFEDKIVKAKPIEAKFSSYLKLHVIFNGPLMQK